MVTLHETDIKQRLACFFIFCLALLLNQKASAQPGEALNFQSPAGFAEITDHADPLFAKTSSLAVSHGKLLKMFLPQYMAQQYRHGNRSVITRQILICEADFPVQRSVSDHEFELLARSMEGIFTGFARVPHGRMDTPAQEIEHRKTALLQSLSSGTPLLVDALSVHGARIYTYLIHYSMDKRDGTTYLSSAVASSLVSASGRPVFITVSSILENNDAATELEWVKDTATSFITAIQKHVHSPVPTKKE